MLIRRYFIHFENKDTRRYKSITQSWRLGLFALQPQDYIPQIKLNPLHKYKLECKQKSIVKQYSKTSIVIHTLDTFFPVHLQLKFIAPKEGRISTPRQASSGRPDCRHSKNPDCQAEEKRESEGRCRRIRGVRKKVAIAHIEGRASK